MHTGLTPAEIASFEANGYLGPMQAWTTGEMDVIRRDLDTVMTNEGYGVGGVQSRHLDSRLVYELCTRPAIVERVASLLGPDLVLWRSNFFVKQPGAKEIPWHQDSNYWPLDPPVNVSAWIAIDESTRETSCVQIIPGSHLRMLEHVPSDARMQFPEMADPKQIDDAGAIHMEMQPGEFFLFNERTLHRSEPNRSKRRRTGLAVRITTPDVRVDHDALFPGHKVLIIRGEDTRGLNRVGEPPTLDVSVG